MIEYLSHSPSREVFIATMLDLVNPITGTPLAWVNEESGELIPSEGVRIDEIGEIVKVQAVLDEEGNEITPPEMVGGHHVNLLVYGPLADLLAANGGWDEIFPLLPQMSEVPSTDGVPAGWQGSSGMRIFPCESVTHRVRVWA